MSWELFLPCVVQTAGVWIPPMGLPRPQGMRVVASVSVGGVVSREGRRESGVVSTQGALGLWQGRWEWQQSWHEQPAKTEMLRGEHREWGQTGAGLCSEGFSLCGSWKSREAHTVSNQFTNTAQPTRHLAAHPWRDCEPGGDQCRTECFPLLDHPAHSHPPPLTFPGASTLGGPSCEG